ncbi:mandelate racemase/muconate lactonizing enzyme family protein [Marinobacter sp. M216]|uniref:Mandelate racemase/muconate lactonizing enzyme family protein n=1 Tax=Marinobacter albus TaxID=3030833 RepID=A0ABT7H6N6_9GAMM|nr:MULTISPECIES: mandelate racemase/muconate lactonizing enzyme family protein [unclassified Marinobacter]MBW7471661.1 mandelate racemase/muconate lactonizing enzyme family protein [Marinobacter sp. F4218]MDK9556021.1 mandelate racemase/muconate lactonizing enzyme family protein [Marinobacter sp. M216]
MRIESIAVYTADLPYTGKAYAFAGGRSHQIFTSTVVVLTTNSGLAGYGEVCPCGPNYMAAFAEGLPSCLSVLAPSVIGGDPRHINCIHESMDQALTGHAVAKAAIDIACWDLLGKSARLPVYTLLGGLITPSMPLHRIVPLAEPAEMEASLGRYRSEGFRHIQIKLGHRVDEDIELMQTLARKKQPDEIWVGDMNGAWRRDQALRFSRAVEDLDLYLEQPCRGYEECLSVRRRCRHPVKLDESLNCLADVQRAIRDDAMDAMALKVSKFGGLTPARVIRDVCVDAGIAMTIEDAWGSGIATAAYAHLAASTPSRVLLNTTDLHNYNTVQLADGAPEVSAGRMTLSDRPGLGVTPDFKTLTLHDVYE